MKTHLHTIRGSFSVFFNQRNWCCFCFLLFLVINFGTWKSSTPLHDDRKPFEHKFYTGCKLINKPFVGLSLDFLTREIGVFVFFCFLSLISGLDSHPRLFTTTENPSSANFLLDENSSTHISWVFLWIF